MEKSEKKKTVKVLIYWKGSWTERYRQLKNKKKEWWKDDRWDLGSPLKCKKYKKSKKEQKWPLRLLK